MGIWGQFLYLFTTTIAYILRKIGVRIGVSGTNGVFSAASKERRL
jgi:hypothetical protein